LLTLMLTSDVRGCKLPLLLQTHRPIKMHTQMQCRLSHVILNQDTKLIYGRIAQEVGV